MVIIIRAKLLGAGAERERKGHEKAFRSDGMILGLDSGVGSTGLCIRQNQLHCTVKACTHYCW